MKSFLLSAQLLVLLLNQEVFAQFVFPQQQSCFTPNYQRGVCINIKSCPPLLNLLSPQPSDEVKYFLQRSQCGLEGNMPKVCCDLNGSNNRPTTNRPNNQRPSWDNGNDNRPTTSTVPKFENTNRNPNVPDVTNHPNLRLLDHERCGLLDSDRIVGGTVAKINEFPWMTLIAYSTGKPYPEFRCGGSVINKRYILTAAHCVTNLPSNLRLIGVRVGDHDTSTEEDCQPSGENGDIICAEKYQEPRVEQVIYHPQYSSSALVNDIALIRVDRDIDFRPANARPICLPIGSAAELRTSKLTVAGWGITENRVSSSTLLKVVLPIFPHDQCVERYKQQTKVTDKQICIGGEQGHDSCNGDSGGPLMSIGVYDNMPRYIQYGLVSFGIRNCGTKGFPGVYTKIEYYLDWILDNMRD